MRLGYYYYSILLLYSMIVVLAAVMLMRETQGSPLKACDEKSMLPSY